MEDFAEQARANAQSWIDWRASNARNGSETPRHARTDRDRALLGLLIQACAESPKEVERVLAPIADSFPWPLNPLTSAGFHALDNLVGNGVNDDWELFLQWRESGYALVGEGARQPQDERLGAAGAFRLLGLITGGSRAAPGEADEAALAQDMFEREAFEPPRGASAPKNNKH